MGRFIWSCFCLSMRDTGLSTLSQDLPELSSTCSRWVGGTDRSTMDHLRLTYVSLTSHWYSSLL